MVSLGFSRPAMSGALTSTKRSLSGAVDEDVAVGVVDVVGERLAGPPVEVWRLLLGHYLVADAEGLPEGGDLRRRAGPQVPVGAELLLVGGQAGHGVAAGVDGGLDEDHPVGVAGGAHGRAAVR